MRTGGGRGVTAEGAVARQRRAVTKVGKQAVVGAQRTGVGYLGGYHPELEVSPRAEGAVGSR